MFGHPLATLAVANEHLDAIGETPLICSDKSCGANGIEGKSLNHYSNDVERPWLELNGPFLFLFTQSGF